MQRKYKAIRILSSVLTLLVFTKSGFGQTTVSAGSVSGTWSKSGSPYKVMGNIYVTKFNKLLITEGVTVEFQGNYKLDVWGGIQVLGKAADTVVFTSKDKTAGWSGLAVHNQSTLTDSVIFNYMKYELIGNQGKNVESAVTNGMSLDTISKLRLSNSLFQNNKGKTTSCFFAKKCSMLLYNVLFLRNSIRDNRTVSGGGSAGVPGFATLNSQVQIFNCTFKNNFRSLPNFSGAFPGGLMTIYDSGGVILNCDFENNGKTTTFKDFTGGIVLQGKLNLEIRECDFINNDFGISFDKLSYCKVSNCLFKDNNLGLALIFPGSGTEVVSKIVLDSNLLINNKDNFMSGDQSINQTIEIRNQKTYGGDYSLSISKVNNCYIYNSIFANAILGIAVNDGTVMNMYNSIVANNKAKSVFDVKADSAASGVSIGDGVEFYATNCIFSGNRSADGKLKNLIVDYEFVSGSATLNNCLIEGGKRTMDFVNSNNLKSYKNIVESAPLFVNPTAGAGPTYDASLADWHPLNTCAGLSPVFNKGTSVLPFGTSLPTYDLEGKARIAQNTVDIGPYEIQSNILPRFGAQPKDTAFCPNATVNMMPFTAYGSNINTTWQSSTSGAGNWQTLSGQSSALLSNYKIPATGPQYFRAIVINPNCNKGDTSVNAKLTINPVPKPNLGKDTFVTPNKPVTFNPGTFSKYRWSTGPQTSTYTLNHADVGGKDTLVWVEVENTFGCKGRDSVLVQKFASNKNTSTMQLYLYPNPTANTLYFGSVKGNLTQIISYSISDLSGKTVATGKLSANENSISIDELSSGFYYLNLQSNSKEEFKSRFVKE